jgi:soluble lytic murein transglycosylase-like protein
MEVKLRSIAGVVAFIAAAGGLAVARAGESSAAGRSLIASRGPDPRLPGAVVVAKRPTLTEILDMILVSEREEDRIAAVLRTRTSNPDRAKRIASALVSEGKRANLSPTLLVGVLLTENPDLEPRATSSVGARGLMQVMPLHAGEWGCPSGDLFDVEDNICHGVRILADNLRHSRSLSAALLRYNGCVSGTNTPDCYLYASKVYREARLSAAGPGGKITQSTPFAFLDAPRTRPRHVVTSR